MKWRTKAIVLKIQHRQRSMILELHKRNPEQKKTHSSDSSDLMFDTTDNYKPTKTVMDSKPTNTNSSSKRVSSLPIKTDLSFVDKILLEESSCVKHSKTGSVNKAKRLQLKPVPVVYIQG